MISEQALTIVPGMISEQALTIVPGMVNEQALTVKSDVTSQVLAVLLTLGSKVLC